MESAQALFAHQLAAAAASTAPASPHLRFDLPPVDQDRVFTGDTLPIEGRPHRPACSDPEALYDSLFGRLSSLDPALRAYPAHDDEGRGHSTIGVELAHNPRLKVQCRETFIELMRGLRLTKPTHITDALPDPRQQLVSCCEFDCISTLAAVKLRRPGFQHAAALDGGMQAWRDTGNPPRTRAEPGTGPALFQRDAG